MFLVRPSVARLHFNPLIPIDDLIAESTLDLFKKMCIPTHCLYHLLPDIVCVTICDYVVTGFNYQLIVLFYIETHL